MSARGGRELGLVLHGLTPVARVGDVDRCDDRAGCRIKSDLDLAAFGATAHGGVDLDILGVRKVQVGELDGGAMVGGANGLTGVLGVGDFAGLRFDATVTQRDGSLA